MRGGESGNDELYPPPLYTNTQENILAFLPYGSAPWSMAGSSLILWSVWFEQNRKSRHSRLFHFSESLYHRLIVAISALDWFTSFRIIVLGPWVVPKDWPYGRSGQGNTATCEVAGFLTNYILAAMFYAFFLSLYFVGLICLEWKDRQMACWLEPLAHGFSLTFTTSMNIMALLYGMFNPLYELPGTCWISENPPFCKEAEDDGAECRGGGKKGKVARDFYGLTMITIWALIITFMCAIVLKAKRQAKRLAFYAGGQSPIVAEAHKRTRETAEQAMLYIFSFIVIFSPAVVLIFVAQFNSDDPTRRQGLLFFFALITKAISPLQGAFNALIFFRNRFASLIRDGESLHFLTKAPIIGCVIVRKLSSSRPQDAANNNHPHQGRIPGGGEQMVVRTDHSECG